MVKDPLQIGFHLSASVHQIQPPRGTHNVAVTFDRRRISSCNCTCNSNAYWCSHVVAVCLTRIHWPHLVTLRAPVSESLSRLHREQLQKFAQYLISELPQQILPTAQRLLDELLGSQPSAINTVCGAPDPTAGASANDQTSWYLDEKTLHNNIKNILIKFCVPAPLVFSDVNYLSTVAPPAAAEWSSLLRPLRGREPEGMWNLLSIVREMFKRNDRNAVPLLEIITEECMACEQILIWWFITKVALLNGSSGYGGSGGSKHNNVNLNTHAAQHACSSVCDEIVVLWRLAALNPGLAPQERDMLHNQFSNWHMKILEKVNKCRNGTSNSQSNFNKNSSLKVDLEVFTGFKPAIEACYLDWDDYPMPGITYTQDINPMYHCPFTCFRHGSENRGEGPQVTQVNSSKAVLNSNSHSHHHHHHLHHPHSRVTHIDYDVVNVISLNPVEFPPHAPLPNRDGNRSSVSSEGFCEVDDDINVIPRDNDSDSQEGSGSDSSMSSSSSANQNNEPPIITAPKEESSSSSEQVSSDDYNVYFYNSCPGTSSDKQNLQAGQSKEPAMFSSIRRCDDPWDVLFSRAEGLHAHGHSREACILGVNLAEELLAHPPDLMIEIPPIPKRKGKKQQVNPATHQLSCLASGTLAKCAFLCSVLAENSEHSHLAFKVGMFGLEMARPAASTKPLEVKLANQEADLVSLLKRIPLGHRELQILRERAEQLKDGTIKSRGEAMLPMTLASFLFDALVIPSVVGRDRVKVITLRLPSDEPLGFEAAVAALGMKANVSEADHPLLCEGTRRQRGELAIALLTFYKDDYWKVARIMERLLDRDIHQLFKSPIMSSYYSSNPPIKKQFTSLKRDEEKVLPPFLPATDMLPGELSCCSRPHSSTSAEIEQGMANLVTSPPQSNNSALPGSSTSNTRLKDTRYKGKRAYPSIPNQPSEAGAHFMFELAKTVLNKAGGNSSTSLFTQPSTSQNHHGPHRALHMCAFQLGLYALGLHNCVSPNWLSRTYSSHVSWITGQAMEIGAAAISFLIETWEGHLTPPEAVSIADRASRGCDINMVTAAAELALSCLPHSHALNPNEIQRAILQCKEQSDEMLEHACLTVESAAKGGGVYPEVLFQVAKYWYEMYLSHTPAGEQLVDHDLQGEALIDPHGGLVALIDPQVGDGTQQVVVGAAPPPPPPYPHPVYYNFVPHPHIAYGGPIHPIHPGQGPPGQLQMYQFQYPAGAAPPPQFAQPTYPPPPQPPPQYYGPVQGLRPLYPAPPPVPQPPGASPRIHRQPHQFSQAQLRYLLTAYRVGMLALETLARRVHDDRPQAKYARNPPYGEDVKWLLQISKQLGTHHLHHFCVCAVNSIVSPFVLHDVAIEAAQYLSRNNPTLLMQHLRTTLTPLVQKCQQMYIQCMHQKLYHLMQSDYEDFVNLVCSARAAFQISPDGSAQFKEWLQSIRRAKSCKKDLWAQINTALQANSK